MGCNSSNSGSAPAENSASGTAPPPRSPTRRWITKKNLKPDDFVKCAIIGEGTFGVVRVVKIAKPDPSLEAELGAPPPMALKAMSKRDVIRLKQVEHVVYEREILSKVRHPLIVELLAAFQDESSIYMLMEYVNGGELCSYILKEGGQLTDDTVRFYAAQLYVAIAFLHSKDIIYRDLKPSNILINCDGNLKVTDFGFAKVVPDTTMSYVGTPEYMAPEIINKQPYGRSVDWWAYGVVVYEMAKGFTPFCGEETDDVYKRILDPNVSFPGKFDSETKKLLEKLLAQQVDKRLGCSKRGCTEIKTHKFFKGINWGSIEAMRSVPPYIPDVKGPDDVSMFERYAERSVSEPIDAIDQQQFGIFDRRLSCTSKASSTDGQGQTVEVIPGGAPALEKANSRESNSTTKKRIYDGVNEVGAAFPESGEPANDKFNGF